MTAKIPVRWMSNSQEGSSENRFIELFIPVKAYYVLDDMIFGAVEDHQPGGITCYDLG